MASEIQKTRTGAVAVHPTREISDLESKFSNRIERRGVRWEIADNLAPSKAEFAALHQRHLDVTGLLHPAHDDEIRMLVAAMFLGFPNLKISPDDAKKTAALYVSQLRDFPAWAVKKACENVLQDRVSGRSPDFAPSVATIAGICRDHVRDLAEENGRLAAIIGADVYHVPSDDERARVKAGFEKLIAELRLNEPFAPNKPSDAYQQLDPDAARAAAESRLSELAAAPAPALSPALRATMGLPPSRPSPDYREAAE